MEEWSRRLTPRAALAKILKGKKAIPEILITAEKIMKETGSKGKESNSSKDSKIHQQKVRESTYSTLFLKEPKNVNQTFTFYQTLILKPSRKR